MTGLDMPDLPEGYFWRIKKSSLAYNPMWLELRRDWGLFSTVEFATSAGQQTLHDEARRLAGDLAWRLEQKKLYGDHGRKKK